MATIAAPHQARQRLDLPTIVGGLLLALGITRQLAEIPLLWELESRDLAEAIVYGQAMRLLHGEPLYQPLTTPPYTVTAYMPLFYTLAAGLHAVFGPSLLAGRLLTLISTVCLSATVAVLARRVTGRFDLAMLATGLVLTLGFAGPPGPPWMAVYRVDVLGVALAVGAVTVLAGGSSADSPGEVTWRRVLAAGGLAALALLTKQTLAAATLAGGLWLLEQDRCKAIGFGVAAVLPALVIGALLQAMNGAFLQNTVTANINPFDSVSLAQNLFIMTIFQLGPMLMALAFLAVRGPCGEIRRGSPHRLLVSYWLATILPMLGLAKVGSWHNYWIEWAVPTAVLAASSLDACRKLFEERSAELAGRARAVFLVTHVPLMVWTLIAAFVAWWSIGVAIDAASTRDARAAELSDVIDCVRMTPGQAIAMPMEVVVLAGKPLYVEPAIFSILADAGVIPIEPLLQTIRSGEVGVVVMDLRPDGDQWFHGAGQPIWREDVLETMRASMTRRSEKAGRLIYTPRDSQPPQACL